MLPAQTGNPEEVVTMLKFIVLFFAAFAVFSPLFLIGIRKYTGRRAKRALGANIASFFAFLVLASVVGIGGSASAVGAPHFSHFRFFTACTPIPRPHALRPMRIPRNLPVLPFPAGKAPFRPTPASRNHISSVVLLSSGMPAQGKHFFTNQLVNHSSRRF